MKQISTLEIIDSPDSKLLQTASKILPETIEEARTKLTEENKGLMVRAIQALILFNPGRYVPGGEMFFSPTSHGWETLPEDVDFSVAIERLCFHYHEESDVLFITQQPLSKGFSDDSPVGDRVRLAAGQASMVLYRALQHPELQKLELYSLSTNTPDNDVVMIRRASKILDIIKEFEQLKERVQLLLS